MRVFTAERRAVFNLIDAALEAVEPPLTRGGHLDRIFRSATHSLYCKSFAATYIVGVLFKGSPSDLLVRRVVKAALPRIETLTLSLPPPDGPERHAGVAKNR